MMPIRPISSRTEQQGGLTIVMALVLVGVMGAATFSLSRNAIRELSMAGTIIQGNKAAAAADAGLDWTITWGQGGVKFSDFTAASPAASQIYFLAGLKQSLDPVLGHPILNLSGSGKPAMSMGTVATTDQNFDLEVRFLGNLAAGRASGGSSNNSGASGDTKVDAAKGDFVWRVLSTGHATPKDAQTYQAQRELVVSVPIF